MRRIAVLGLGCLLAGLLPALAADETQRVRIVYIHGTNNRPDPGQSEPDFPKRAAELHRSMCKRTLGHYQVSADPVIVQWWDLPQRQDCWYHGGLDALHAQAPAGLPLFLGHSAPTARSLLHDVAHDAAWLISDGRNLTDAFDRVDQALAAKLRPDEPYIIIGHSGGAILTYKFLQQRLFAGSPATRPGRFLGAITIGSPVNTFLSSDLMRDSLPEGFLAPAPEAGSQRPFWINICHHNDIIATSLNPALTTGTERRICCRDVVIRRTLLERIPVIKEFTYWKSHLWAAHGWYFAKPGAFSDVVEDAIAALPATAINGGVAP